MFLFNKAELFILHNNVYLRLQLKDIVNFFQTDLREVELTHPFLPQQLLLLPCLRQQSSLIIAQYWVVYQLGIKFSRIINFVTFEFREIKEQYSASASAAASILLREVDSDIFKKDRSYYYES